MSYLQSDDFYNDLYDLMTIRECLPVSDHWKECAKNNRYMNASDEAMGRFAAFGSEFQLHFMKGERYARKSATIREWQNEARAKDQQLEEAQAPRNVSCRACFSRTMKVISKDLHDWGKGPCRPLFLFECSSCHKRQGVYEDGTPYLSKNNACDTEITAGESRWEKERAEERRLLEQYRQEFCLSENEGAEYLVESLNMKEIVELSKQIDRQNNDPDYKKVQSLQRLTVLALEKQLTEVLNKEKFPNLRFGNPEIDKYVIIPFTIQDEDSARQGRASELKAQRLIKDALISTNWRLMSQGLSYRLGCLSGQLKGYESEDELLGLIKSDNS